MIGRNGRFGRLANRQLVSRAWRVLRWAGLAASVPALWACTSRTLEAPVITPTQVFGTTVTEKINRDMDLLFMIDNSSSMTGMQTQLLMNLPVFIETLESMTDNSLPNLHVAVVSSDMGAPSNVELMNCNNTGGDNGAFQIMPRGTCTGTTLSANAEFISNDGGNNFTQADNGAEPGMAIVFQCIALLGESGCGFEHQLASVDHALGSDNFDTTTNPPTPQPPSTNGANFLRPDAYLGIVLFTNEDDCSAPSNTGLFNLNTTTGANDISDPQGPIANYRCNQFGHICTDPNGNTGAPPLNPPAGSAAGASEMFTDCVSNENGPLIPVMTFVDHIKELKQSPDTQILVAAIMGPTSPYTVEWLPGTGSTAATMELWPQITHSCGTENADGSGVFADPGVRLQQFVEAFGKNGLISSICDASYAPAMTTIAKALNALATPKCLPSNLQTYTDPSGATYPNCTVTDNVTGTSGTTEFVSIPSCMSPSAAANAPCWNVIPDTTGTCPADAPDVLQLVNDTTDMAANGLNTTVQCATCPAGVALAGCP